jgi:hypothetical protein
MRLRTLLSILLAGGALYAGSSDGRAPVIVELFTSEGCSSCPPADEVLMRLSRMQSVSNARVIVLGEHVDYWNNLGWVDPFSSPQFRARQNDYAQAFKVESVYTPQMVVNGRAEFVGDDIGRAMSEIGRAAAQPSATVSLKAVKNATDQELFELAVNIRDLPAINIRGKRGVAPVDVYLAVTEDNLTSNVQHGENSGRSLRHAAVVRSFGVIGNMDPREKDEVSLRPTLKIPSNWKRKDLHAVVFVQERSTRHILGAESVSLN